MVFHLRFLLTGTPKIQNGVRGGERQGGCYVSFANVVLYRTVCAIVCTVLAEPTVGRVGAVNRSMRNLVFV